MHAAAAAAPIPVIWRFARRRTGPWFAALAAATYAFGWPLQATLDFDFHEIDLALPLAALAVDALDRRDDRRLLIWAGLLLLVREDMGVLVATFGLLRVASAWRARRSALPGGSDPAAGRRWPGVALIGGGLLAYWLATSVFIPALAPGGHYTHWQYTALGKNAADLVAGIVAHPWRAIRLFFTPYVKTQTLLYALVPLGLVSLRSRYAVLALPLFAERFFSSRTDLWGTHFQYSALPGLLLVLAMIDGAGLLGLLKVPASRSRAHRAGAAALAAWLVAVPVWLTITNHVVPSIIRATYDGTAFAVTPHVEAQEALVAAVPSNVCVAVDDRLAPHLTRRDFVTLADRDPGTTDFVALDLTQARVAHLVGPTPQQALVAVLARGYATVFDRDGMLLLRSPTYAGPSTRCGPLGPGEYP